MTNVDEIEFLSYVNTKKNDSENKNKTIHFYTYDWKFEKVFENPEEEFILIASDIYHFKLFNQILGANTGDDLLLAFAQAYREHYKRMWVFSRIAADRFALLIPKSDYDEENLLKIVQEVLDRKNYSLKVHAYLGLIEVSVLKVCMTELLWH